jgi:hypothetical protein
MILDSFRLDPELLGFARQAPFPARSKLKPSSPALLVNAASMSGFNKGFLPAAAQIAWGCLFEAHEQVQRHEGEADADYLHALIHRFEGDDSNHRWWLRQVGRHPVHSRLEVILRQAQNLPPEWAPLATKWDGALAAKLDQSEHGVDLRRLEWLVLCGCLRLDT